MLREGRSVVNGVRRLLRFGTAAKTEREILNRAREQADSSVFRRLALGSLRMGFHFPLNLLQRFLPGHSQLVIGLKSDPELCRGSQVA